MIAFGTTITEPDAYRRYAEPGIRRAAEGDSDVFAFAAVGSVPRSYNLLLDTAARRDDLEALAIVHPHAEIADPGFCGKVREALGDPEVAVVGCVGATGVRSIAWWEGSVASAPIVHRYVEKGGGELPGFAWARPDAPLGEVETVAGFLLVLSPWAVRSLRFDESLKLNYGYDLDYCLRARKAGRKVVAADLPTIYHHSLDLIGDLDLWIEAHIQLAERWDEGEPDEDAWRRRARRAEASREAARALVYSNMLIADAMVARRERELAEATESLSWRVTAPLRALNRMLAERRAPGP
jgi:Glycosyltransferase like family